MTPSERERAYSPSSCLEGDNYRPFLEAYAARSAEAVARTQALGATWMWPPMGDESTPRIAVCKPPLREGARAPLLVFIHGGYWQELSARDSLFAALSCVERGIAFAALDYTLAPQASIAQIVDECERMLAWLVAHAPSLRIDPARVVVAGSSAGAHLAAMVSRPGVVVPAWRPRAAVLVSGIYELEPLIGTSINDALHLDVAQARAASPALLPLEGFASCVVCWGEIETQAFKQQSIDFAARLEAAGVSCRCFEVPARNHFDVILDLADASSAAGAAAFERLR